jgi:hypothetical protein
MLLFSLSVGAGYVYAQTVKTSTDRPIRAFTFAYATNGTNSTAITVTCLDANGNFIPYAHFDFWLSTSGDGGSITTVVPVGTDGIVILGSIGTATNLLTTTGAGLAFPFSVQADATGKAKFGVTNVAKTLWFPVAAPSGRTNSRAVGTKLVTGNYGFILWGEITRGLWAIMPRMSARFGGLY